MSLGSAGLGQNGEWGDETATLIGAANDRASRLFPTDTVTEGKKMVYHGYS
jgi:hypothetical protein